MKKCDFNVPELKWVGFIVGRDGLEADPAKISAVVNYPVPNSLTALKRFLGLAVQLHKFVEHYSWIVAPFTNFTSKKEAAELSWLAWDAEHLAVFNEVKRVLTTPPMLATVALTQPFCSGTSYML